MIVTRWHEYVRRCVVILTGIVLWGICAAAPASAHAVLTSTTPRDGQILSAQPTQVSLTFGEAVSTALGNLEVLTSTGIRADTGQTNQSDDGHTVIIPLKPGLKPGSYVIIWRVISADSHPVSGTFTFSIGHPTAIAAPNANPPGLGAPSILLGVTRGLGFASLMLWLGGALFLLVLWPQGLTLRRSRLILLWSAAIEAILSAAAIPLQASYAAGVNMSRSIDVTLIGDVLKTNYGVVTLIRGGICLVAAVSLQRPSWFTRPLLTINAILGLGAAVTWTLAGHAGTGSLEPIAAVLDATHIVSASAWVGGLVWLSILLGRRSNIETAQRLLPKWSRWATAAVGLIVASGVFATYRQLRSVDALVHTQYGLTLMLKTVFVGAMLLYALKGRQWVRRVAHYQTRVVPASWRSLRRSVAIETSLAAFVLAITAVLVQTSPATAVRQTGDYEFTVINGPKTVHTELAPAAVGVNTLTLKLYDSDGKAADVPEVSALLSSADGHVFTAHLIRSGPGIYTDTATILPGAGDYELTIQVRVNDFDSYPSVQTIYVQ